MFKQARIQTFFKWVEGGGGWWVGCSGENMLNEEHGCIHIFWFIFWRHDNLGPTRGVQGKVLVEATYFLIL